jgi:hypothetical protein
MDSHPRLLRRTVGAIEYEVLVSLSQPSKKTMRRAAQYVRRVADMMSVTMMNILAAYSMCVVALEGASDVCYERV